MCKCWFHYFKKLDGFNVPISFRHKREDTYATWIGGFITFIIVALALIFCIIYLIPFIKKENYSLYYYTINLNKTEEFNLANSKSSIAFRFECSGSESRINPIDNFLDFQVKYIYYKDGEKVDNENSILAFHNCTNSDFYNVIDLSDYNENYKLTNLRCLNNTNNVVKNRYQDRAENFAYYQIDTIVKDTTNISRVNQYLLDNDCKVELYYIDSRIEVDDFKKPIKPFLNEIFLQLNPNISSRMNAYFMNSYFESNNDLFFETKGDDKINIVFSKTELYFRFIELSKEDSFGKLYIRADTKKMIIKRTYQTLTEFFAVTFSFWEDLFLICSFLITAYNKFCLNYSIERKLFFFKEIKNDNFDTSKHASRIQDLIGLTNSFTESKIYQKSEGNNLIENKVPTTQSDTKPKKDLELFKRKYTLDRHKLVPKKICDFFNFFECRRCNCTRLDSQAILYSKAEAIIDSKLDVSYYLKSILWLDLYTNIIMEDKKEILKFLCMPIINANTGEKDDFYEYHEIYSNQDFERLNEEISQLVKKQTNDENEKKLLAIVNQRLNELNS